MSTSEKSEMRSRISEVILAPQADETREQTSLNGGQSLQFKAYELGRSLVTSRLTRDAAFVGRAMLITFIVAAACAAFFGGFNVNPGVPQQMQAAPAQP